MNKKGFLKIIEAIVAIVIVLAFVIAILPARPKETAKIPPDLEQTTNSLLQEMQNNPDFRRCVLGEGIAYDFDNNPVTPSVILSGAECVNGYIVLLSQPVSAHPWNYSVKICKVNTTSLPIDCNYYPPVSGAALSDKEQAFANSLPKDKDIYRKEVTLTVADVSGRDPSISGFGNYTILTVYAWLK